MDERKEGARAAGLISKLITLGFDADVNASGSFLRDRVSVEVEKPLHRGVLFKTDKEKSPDWFEIRSEKLLYYYYSCGLMGHSKLECSNPARKNALGKLPYELELRAPED